LAFFWFPGLKRHQTLLGGEDPMDSWKLPGTSRWGQNLITCLLVSYRPQSGELKKHQLLLTLKDCLKDVSDSFPHQPPGKKQLSHSAPSQYGKRKTASAAPSSTEKEQRKSTI